ncbi:MAG: hypothetical protein ACREDO_03115 [Methyloceanibacter sp.]
MASWGERTRSTIKLFERRNGLDETGKVSTPFMIKLERLTN